MNGVDYNQLWIHRLMLGDLVRGETYRRAIESVITPDSVVLDMGAGSGILSFFAAAAGAKKVYAIERTDIVNLTRELAHLNGLSNRVEIIQADVLDIKLTEKVDVLVSEWLGPFGVDENLLYPLLITRDRWLKKEGLILPNAVTAWMAPAYDPVLNSDMFFWQSRPYGFNLEPIARHSANEIRYSQEHISPENLLASPQPMWRTDLYAFPSSDARLPFHSSRTFICQRDSLLNCVIVWFDAEFPGGNVLACGPGAPKNHWGSTVCPLASAVQTGPGTEIRVEFTCECDEFPGRSFSKWSVSINNTLHEEHDTKVSLD